MDQKRRSTNVYSASPSKKSMIELLKDIVSSLVDHPEEVSLEEETYEEGLTTLKLKVHQEDMGRVIGKEGKIIQALRTLMRVAAMKQGRRIRIELVEPQNASYEPEKPKKSDSNQAEKPSKPAK